MSLITLMILCYAGFLFVPIIPAQKIPKRSAFNFTSIDGVCDKQLTVEYKHLYKQNKNEIKFVNSFRCHHEECEYMEFIISWDSFFIYFLKFFFFHKFYRIIYENYLINQFQIHQFTYTVFIVLGKKCGFMFNRA